MRTPIVAGNWKLNGCRESIVTLANGVVGEAPASGVELVLCPVALHIPEVAQLLHGSAVALGAQNASVAASGAYTGEVSSAMLAEYGCRYVIAGHSERRSLFGESNEDCAARAASAAEAGLTPVFCVGETLEQREAGNTLTVIKQQLSALLEAAGATILSVVVVAYEPVWAIGTGVVASPEQAQQVHAEIRQFLAEADAAAANKLRILYGGSVKPDNALELFRQTDIDGGLIGGAALSHTDFIAIAQAATQTTP